MNKSSRTAMSTTSRRFSQPVVPSSSNSSSTAMSSSRRGSEMVGGARGGGGGGDGGLPPPPAGSSSSAQFDVVEAKGPRKIRAKDSDGPSFDADQYNPDGSLRTIHRLPDFHKSYAEAGKARYIRHTKKNAPDREKELPLNQIFKD